MITPKPEEPDFILPTGEAFAAPDFKAFYLNLFLIYRNKTLLNADIILACLLLIFI